MNPDLFGCYSGFDLHEPEETKKKWSLLLLLLAESLSEKQREVIFRYYLKKETIPQIAKQLGLHKSSVSRRLSRGKKQLLFLAEALEKSGFL